MQAYDCHVNLDLVYHILKYVALILAAVMALVTLVKKTRDDGGQLTQHGKWYYALIILFLCNPPQIRPTHK